MLHFFQTLSNSITTERAKRSSRREVEFSLAFLAKCHECHKTMVNERDEQEDKVGNTADGHVVVSKHRRTVRPR